MALEHGGRLREAAKRYGIAETDWLDLSTGINPDGWPVPEIPSGMWQALPQQDDDLHEAACRFYRTAQLLPVSGSQAAIQALPGLRAPCSVALAYPAYAEHEYAWRMHGHRILRTDDVLQSDADVVVIVNPNNPTGRRYGVEQLLALHERLAARGGWLVVDEAFMDATPEHSLAPFCPRAGLVVLRSLGKFFGLAGARVGFVLGPQDVLSALAEKLGPWPIATPSRYVATRALNDETWQQGARSALLGAGERLEALLARRGLTPSGGNALFQWLCINDAVSVHRQLAQQGILTRLFDEPASLRFGLPGRDEHWARLDEALKRIKR
jgi:L-threonine-O-3-phosphate decarboxylase